GGTLSREAPIHPRISGCPACLMGSWQAGRPDQETRAGRAGASTRVLKAHGATARVGAATPSTEHIVHARHNSTPRAAQATADAGPRLRIHRNGAGRRRRPADAVSALRWVLPSLPPGLRWARADLAARRSRGHTGRAALRDTPCGLPGVRSHDGVGALGRPRLVVQPDRLACNPKSAGPLGRHPRPGPKMASALHSSRRTVMGRVTANKMEVVTSGSNHPAVGMAVSVRTPPAAPSPIPVPCPTMAPPKHRRYLNGPG